MTSTNERRPLAALLIDLERVLREHDVPVVEHLAPGLPPGRIRATLAELGLDPHPDLVTWWTWHNGVRTYQWMPDYALKSMHWPLPLDIAVDRYREQVEDYDPQVPSTPLHVFPVVSWRNNGALCVDTVSGSIIRSDPWDHGDASYDPFEPRWPSLSAWITDVMTLWRSGAVRMTENGTEIDGVDEHEDGETPGPELFPAAMQLAASLNVDGRTGAVFVYHPRDPLDGPVLAGGHR